MPDGSLVSRSSPDAFVHDPIEAAERVIRMLREKKVRAIDGNDVAVRRKPSVCMATTPKRSSSCENYVNVLHAKKS